MASAYEHRILDFTVLFLKCKKRGKKSSNKYGQIVTTVGRHKLDHLAINSTTAVAAEVRVFDLQAI